MIHLTRLIVILIISIVSITIGYAQQHTDSLRLVNEALRMIQFSEPEFFEPFMPNLDAKAIADMGFEQPYKSEEIVFNMRDGAQIHGQNYKHDSNRTVLLLHGTLANSFTYNKMSGLLREAMQANIISIDLRGHGQSQGVVGDISTINQYAEDLDDLIFSLRKENFNETIILAGHSMGGGIVLRHAETFPQTKIDAYVLFAPSLGNNSPTTSKELNLKSNFIKTHLSRGLGLSVLNEFGIHEYDSLHVIFYNLPKQMLLKSYSYRSMQASFPLYYRKALQSIFKPLLVIVGSKEEAFISKEYPNVVKSYSSGECFIIENETHNGIRHNKEAMNKVSNWAILNKLK